MAIKRVKKEKFVELHNNGSLWAKGSLLNGEPEGLFKWYRKDGTLMRMGSFKKGKQVGTWTTFNKNGGVVKITKMK